MFYCVVSLKNSVKKVDLWGGGEATIYIYIYVYIYLCVFSETYYIYIYICAKEVGSSSRRGPRAAGWAALRGAVAGVCLQLASRGRHGAERGFLGGLGGVVN